MRQRSATIHPVTDRGQIVVIGGGIIGLAVADELVRRGCAVTVLTAGQVADGASGVNAGWVVPALSDPVPAPGVLTASLRWMLRSDSPFYVRPRLSPSFARWMLEFRANTSRARYLSGLEAMAALNVRTIALYDRWRAEGLAFEEHRDGLLLAYRTEGEAQHELDGLGWLGRFGFPPATLGHPRELEPALADSFHGAVLLAGERHVDSTGLAGALVARLRGRGVDVHTDDPALALEPRGDRVSEVRTRRGRRFAADSVVVAAGAWTPALTRALRVRLPILGGKGYGLDFGPPPVRLRRSLYLHDRRVAMTPYADRLRLSGTMELTGLDTSIAPRRVAAIVAAAAGALRGWPADARPTRVASGLRPLTPDGLPVIGRVGRSNVFVASGHSMLGVTLAPATAEALAEVITGGTPHAVLERFDPGRFGWRSRRATARP